MRRPHRGDARQLVIDWTAAPVPAVTPTTMPPPAVPVAAEPSPPVQVLPWDFHITFPPVLAEAIEAGTVTEEDAEPEALAGLHAEHAGAMLAALRDADRARDARRRGADPATGKVPRTAKGKRELQAKLDGEVRRLDRWQQTLLDTYEEAFGPTAGDQVRAAVQAYAEDFGRGPADELLAFCRRQSIRSYPARTP